MRSTLLALALFLGAVAQTTAQDLTAKSKAVLARIDGEFKLPGLKEPVEVLRDKWGVPHIYAKNQDDLFFAQGFVAAQDRLFQLDIWRRTGRGEMAEIIGPDALDGDIFARTLMYRGDMKAEWDSYSPDTKQIALAFTSGINAWIKQTGDRLPIEFQMLNFKPKLWEPEDILLRMSGIIMSRNFQDEVVRAHLIDKLGLEKVRMLMPTDPKRDFAPAVDVKGIDARILKRFQAATKSVQFKPSESESNNWAVSGKLSASGKPMLASDPHRAIALPALRYLVHLNAPGWNAIGAGEPALPGIALGHNEKIAWGITIVGTDQADIFVEETKPGNFSLYKAGDKWEQMRRYDGKIPVKTGDGMRAATFLAWETRHGPVIHFDTEANRAYVLKWAGSEPGGAAYLPGLAVSRAQNHEEFLKALERWKIPSLNFMYADVDGNIAWLAAAATPIRPKHDGLLPVPGNSGFEWKGYLPTSALPQDLNPKSGWLATANHNIIPPGYKHQIGYEFAAPYRFDRVAANLDGKKNLTLEDFQRIQHGNLSVPGMKLAKFAKPLTMQFSNPLYSDAAKVMADWNGRLLTDSPAGVIYAQWLIELQRAVYGRHVPKELIKDVAAKSGLPTLFHVLENPDEKWFGKQPDFTRDQIIQESFFNAINELMKRGYEPGKTRWGAVHTATFRHPFSGNDKLAKLLNIGPYERTGDGNTPNNTRYDDKFQQVHGATYRHLFDLADWDKGLATSAPGQSGQFGSPHYGDLAPLWAEGRYFPLAYSRKKVEEVTANRMMLRPAN